MNLGHPELVATIAAEIELTGPMTFARFMELALYHPVHGYYTNREHAAERIGFSGDYYTSPDVHPVLAQALARQIHQMDGLLGQPDAFTIIEMGPGKGQLAQDVLTACRKISEASSDRFFDRLQYILIERSPTLQAVQRRLLGSMPAGVTWLESLRALDPNSITGVLLSNELVDAFPVHRIRVEGGTAKEIYVELRDGRFRETLRPLSTPELTAYLGRLKDTGVSLQEGQTAEINLDAISWMHEVARVLGRGYVVTIDYGHTAQDLFGPDRRHGTLLCYFQQLTSDNPYERVGLQDMTAHVDFSALATAGEQVGLQVTGFTNQMSFLIGMGVEQMLDSLEPGSAEFQSFVQLLRPEGMGRTFKILLQHKGVPHPELDGLRYRPFFGSALTAEATKGVNR